MTFRLETILMVLLMAGMTGPAGTMAAPTPDEVWNAQVAPLLDKYCSKCHAGVRQKSGLDLRSIETILRGGDRGPSIIPGKPEESHLFEFVLPGADPHMPVEGKKQLGPQEIEILRGWIKNLPLVKSPLASGSSTNNTWVPAYLTALRELEKPKFVPPPDLMPNEAIDAVLKFDWQEHQIKPAKLCGDRVFARRIYLDLAGRIPTIDEVETFLKQPKAKRREHLIDALLASDEYSKHMRDVFDVILLGRPRGNNEKRRKENGWYDFLEDSFRANRPWNDVIQEIVLSRSTNGPTHGAFWYLYEKRNNYQAMAENLAPVAFGVQMKCAQCHNHPLAWEIEQRHYWGMVAAFNRSKNVEGGGVMGVSESAVGGFVQFANLKKESQPAVLAFLNGTVVEEKRPKENEKENDAPDLYIIPPAKDGQKMTAPSIPKFSRREALAEAITRNNPLLARAFVNRTWELLMGRGIVHPVDQMDSRHRPSHPVLLDWLATDFEKHGYDVKRLIRGVVLSHAYQLDSLAPGRTPSPASSFARAIDKPLSAEQLLASLLVATGNKPAADGKISGHDSDELRGTFVKHFPDLMPAVYNLSMEQALFWSNSKLLDDLLKPQSGNTMSTILALSSPDARIERAFASVLSRAPDTEEKEKLRALLLSEAAESGIKNLVWTLVASAEFQLNH